jgi:hypothetical protein
MMERGIHMGIWWEGLKEIDRYEDIAVDGKITLN